jgi:predicted nucleic acid-binding protein
VILVDTSAWVEYLRATGSKTHRAVRELIAGRADLATTDVVTMELLAGARDATERESLRRLLLACAHLPVQSPSDYEEAADVYALCRREGATVRKLTDCLIAVVAIREDAELLHCDADFTAIAARTTLRCRSS